MTSSLSSPLSPEQIAACLDYARDLAEFEPSSDAAVWPIPASNSIVENLRDASQVMCRLRDVLRVESIDSVVIAKAQQLNLLLLSLNGDFADIVAYPPNRYNGIVALRLRKRAPKATLHSSTVC